MRARFFATLMAAFVTLATPVVVQAQAQDCGARRDTLTRDAAEAAWRFKNVDASVRLKDTGVELHSLGTLVINPAGWEVRQSGTTTVMAFAINDAPPNGPTSSRFCGPVKDPQVGEQIDQRAYAFFTTTSGNTVRFVISS